MQRRPNCPICRENSGKSVFSLNYDSEPLKRFLEEFYAKRQGVENRVDMEYLRDEKLVIRHCSDCDFYWHEYILDDDGMRALYEKWINAEHSRQKRNDWSRRLSKVQKASYLRTYFEGRKPPENLRVLDFGMGWGSYLQAVRALGCEAHGVEVSDVRRKKVRSENIVVYEDIAEVSGEFDVIASHQTFEHIPNPNGTLASLCELLADDGLLHITTPTATHSPSIETVLTKGPFQPLEHINGFTQKSMLELTDNHDLSPVNVDQSLVQHPQSQTLRHRIRLILLLTNTYWLYGYFNEQSKQSFFTPEK